MDIKKAYITNNIFGICYYSLIIQATVTLQGSLLALLGKLEHRVRRVCIVDTPVDYAFLPDSFFSYMARNMPLLQVILWNVVFCYTSKIFHEHPILM